MGSHYCSQKNVAPIKNRGDIFLLAAKYIFTAALGAQRLFFRLPFDRLITD